MDDLISKPFTAIGERVNTLICYHSLLFVLHGENEMIAPGSDTVRQGCPVWEVFLCVQFFRRGCKVWRVICAVWSLDTAFCQRCDSDPFNPTSWQVIRWLLAYERSSFVCQLWGIGPPPDETERDLLFYRQKILSNIVLNLKHKLLWSFLKWKQPQEFYSTGFLHRTEWLYSSARIALKLHDSFSISQRPRGWKFTKLHIVNFQSDKAWQFSGGANLRLY